MTWTEIVTVLLANKAAFYNTEIIEANLKETSRPEDVADCCGVTFGQHVTWRGLWISCNKNRKASWTRNKNRQAKLRKQNVRFIIAGISETVRRNAAASGFKFVVRRPISRRVGPNTSAFYRWEVVEEYGHLDRAIEHALREDYHAIVTHPHATDPLFDNKKANLVEL